MSDKKAKTDSTLRILAVSGIIAPIIFAVVVIILGFLEPGYSHLTQAISELGQIGATNAVVQNVNFAILGILLLIFSVGLHRGITKGSILGPLLLAIFAIVSLLGNAIFACDPGCLMEDANSRIHNMLGLTGFVAFILAPLTLSRRLKKDNLWNGYGRYSIISGVLAILFLLIFIVGSAALSESLPFIRGIFQRLFIGTLLLWVEVMAIRLYQITKKP